MTNQQKTILFWLGSVLGLVVIAFFLVTIQQKQEMGYMGNQMSFSGEGKVSAKPELALVDFSIVSSAKTSKGSQDANSAIAKRVYDFLKKNGVNEKDIKTTTYYLNPQYTYPTVTVYPRPGINYSPEIMIAPAPYPTIDTAGGKKITGYEMTQGYQVKIRDLEAVSQIVDGLVVAGANQVSNVYFDFENREKLVEQARQKAIKDAREKADVLEKQLGVKLGKIINYYEGGNGGIYSYAKGGEMGYGGGGDSVMPVIPSGENEINVTVTITYQVK